MNKISFLFLCLYLVSCSSIVRTQDGAESVQIIFLDKSGSRYLQPPETACEFVGEVIGSEGHWYSYLFTSNARIVQGAINDLKNSVYAKNGNVVIVYGNIDLSTSVTLLGQAYNCRQAESKDKARF